jgi:hypothetical protein
MRESRTYGSVRGALSNERPYRDAFCNASIDGDKLTFWDNCAVVAGRSLRPLHSSSLPGSRLIGSKGGYVALASIGVTPGLATRCS